VTEIIEDGDAIVKIVTIGKRLADQKINNIANINKVIDLLKAEGITITRGVEK